MRILAVDSSEHAAWSHGRSPARPAVVEHHDCRSLLAGRGRRLPLRHRFGFTLPFDCNAYAVIPRSCLSWLFRPVSRRSRPLTGFPAT